MEDVMMKRKEATEFFQRDRRDLNHECYSECCTWEEVREHYEHDIAAAVCFIELFHFIISTLPVLPFPPPVENIHFWCPLPFRFLQIFNEFLANPVVEFPQNFEAIPWRFHDGF